MLHVTYLGYATVDELVGQVPDERVTLAHQLGGPQRGAVLLARLYQGPLAAHVQSFLF
jgi:hypothetical protein